jgi:hypothetical protein
MDPCKPIDIGVRADGTITAAGMMNVVVTRAAKRMSAIIRTRENLIDSTINFNLRPTVVGRQRSGF